MSTRDTIKRLFDPAVHKPYLCRTCGRRYELEYYVCPACGGFSVENDD